MITFKKISWRIILMAFFFVIPVKQIYAQQSPEEKFNMVMYAIMNMYVDSVSKAEFVDRQITRMLQELDPFTMYLPAQQAKMKEQSILAQPAAVPSNSTSVKLSPNINNNQTSTKPINKLSSLKYYMLDKVTGFIQLTIFSEVAANEFCTAVNALKKDGMKNLIIDLRNNHGGLTDVAVEIADELLDGDKIVFTAEGAHVDRQVFKTKKSGCFEKGLLALLVNGETMSAAELFAGAIQDWDRGVIVGETTFGKGLIQETLPFQDGSAIQISVARYLTPCGRSIQKSYLDSIPSVNDKLSYVSCLNKRPLSSNMGIVPDVTVPYFPAPYETSWYMTFLFNRCAAEMAKTYQDSHVSELKFKSQECFINDFNPELLKETVKEKIRSLGMTVSEEDFNKSIDRVLLETKAYLGRSLFGSDECYYRIIAANDNPRSEHHANLVLRKAWDTIRQPVYYQHLLGKQ